LFQGTIWNKISKPPNTISEKSPPLLSKNRPEAKPKVGKIDSKKSRNSVPKKVKIQSKFGQDFEIIFEKIKRGPKRGPVSSPGGYFAFFRNIF